MRKANQEKRTEKQGIRARIQIPKWHRGETLKCGSNPGSVLHGFCRLFLLDLSLPPSGPSIADTWPQASESNLATSTPHRWETREQRKSVVENMPDTSWPFGQQSESLSLRPEGFFMFRLKRIE